MTSVPPGHPHNDHEPLCLPLYVIHDHMMTICHPHNDHEPFCVSLYAIHDHMMTICHPHYDHEPLCVPLHMLYMIIFNTHNNHEQQPIMQYAWPRYEEIV